MKKREVILRAALINMSNTSEGARAVQICRYRHHKLWNNKNGWIEEGSKLLSKHKTHRLLKDTKKIKSYRFQDLFHISIDLKKGMIV